MNLEKELKGVLVRRMKIEHQPRKKWPVEKRIEVVTKYLALGNLRLVSELTGVSYGLIRMWKGEPWWTDLVAEIRATRHINVDNKLSKIVDKSLEMLGDRLENGEVVYNKKTGELERKELSVLTVNKIANDMMIRQIELGKQKIQETNSEKQQTVADQIRLLAEEFAKFNTKRTIEVKVKDVTDAVYEEREEGLQTGVREISGSSGPDSESLGEESSSESGGESWLSDEGGWEGCGPQEASLEGGSPDEEVELEGGSESSQPFLPSNIQR